MNDPRLLPFLGMLLGALIVGTVSTKSAKIGREYRKTKVISRPQLAFIFAAWPTDIVIAGWVDQTGWNMVMPQLFQLPSIDLFTAIIFGALVASLIKGTSGILNVRVVEPLHEERP